MHIYGEHNGIKFRVNATGPLSLDTLNAIKKMVALAAKTQNPTNNGINKTTSIS